jgi:PII-like signaling protein
VTEDLLKLTAYFGERQRHGDRFLSDELLGLYAESEVATSVVLRGIAGFGPRHELRSDQSLSMSEDLPVAIAAVDAAEKIAGLAERAVELTTRGLITLERASLIGRSASSMPETAKLTVYVGRQERVSGHQAYRAVCELLHRHEFASTAVFLGVDGTAHGQRHRAHFFGRNADVPVMIIAVGAGARVAEVLPQLEGMLHRPLLTVERAQLCKRDGELLTRPLSVPASDRDGRALWQKLMVYTSEATLHDGEPIHRAIVRKLQGIPDSRGATVLRGVWGFHGDHPPHGDRLVQLGRQVPVTTIVVDNPDRIAASFDVIDELTGRHGVVTSELVPALISIDGSERRGGTALGRFDQA